MTNEEREARLKKTRDQMYTAGVVIVSACIIIVFYFCVDRYKGLSGNFNKFTAIIRPIFIGFVLAFLINPIMCFFERHLIGFFLKHSKTQEKAKKTARVLSTLIAVTIFMSIVTVFIVSVVPQLIDTIKYLAYNIQDQIAAVLDWCDEITKGRYTESLMSAKDSEFDKALDATLKWIEKYLDYDQDKLISVATNSVFYVYKLFFATIVGIFVSMYVLIDKEKFKGQSKKMLYGYLKTDTANIILEVCRKASDIFYGFIMGKIIDSLIIGLICYISILIMDMPYPILVSVIVGVTNIIPVFGPYIGAVPTVIIIFLTEPWKGIIFLAFIIILQQIDGNLIGPKILGDSTGISAFWVVVAVVVGGGLFGILGMIVGVPVVALIYYLAGRYTGYKLRKKDLPEETDTFVNLERIDSDTKELFFISDETKARKHTKLSFNLSKKKKKESEK